MPPVPTVGGLADEGIDELRAKAQRPSSVEVRVDPVTFDRLFIVRFEDRDPLLLAVAPTDLAAILHTLSAAIAQSLN